MINNLKISNKDKSVLQNTFLGRMTPTEIDNKFNEAYLGVLVNDKSVFNPLEILPSCAHDKFAEYICYLMGQPDYLYFLIKYILQIDSWPQQVLLIKEMFTHRFPILIGARGLSKCLTKDTFIISKTGPMRVKDLNIKPIPYIQQNIGNVLLHGENSYNKVEYGWYNKPKKTKIIHTRSGRRIECTLNHPLRVVSSGKIDWKDAEFLKVGNYLPLMRNIDQWDHNDLTPNVAYMIGAIIGDGCFSNKSNKISFTNIDKECINNVNKGLKEWNKSKLKLVNLTNGKKLQYSVINSSLTGPDIKNEFIKQFSANIYNGSDNKITPKVIMSAKFESVAAYLCGLFDTDGCCHTNNPIVEFSTKSYELAEETQFLLLCLGINANLKTQLNKKYNKYYYKLQISGSSLRIFKDKIGFRIKRKQRILEKHCLYKINDNLDIIPRELILDNLLTTRELARDTIYKTNNNKNGSRIINMSVMKKYDMTYDKLHRVIEKFKQSNNASNSYELKMLEEVYNNNYYYDQIVSIEDGFSETYDVHLEGNDHSFISNGMISHNSYSLAVYMLLRMILIPGTKCVITSAGFRQAKVVFEYMETIYKKSLMLQSCFPESRKNGPVHGTDVWTFRVGDSITYAIPVGPDGSKVRGYRANCVDKNTLIQTENGLVKIKDFLSSECDSVMNINSLFECPNKFYKTELTDVYELKTELGYSIKYSVVHRLHTPNGWKVGTEIEEGDEVILDTNDYFPEDYAVFNGCQLDEYEIFSTGLINLSSLAANEVPWYILQSPRGIIYRFLKMHFGHNWTNASYVTQHLEKARQLQILLLKFGYKSKLEDINSMYRLTICGQIHDIRFTDTVVSVTKLPYQDELYDFVLPETESFIGNGFVNHNCLISDEFACTRRSLLQTDKGLLRIEDIVENRLECNVINKHGNFEPIIDWVKTPKTDVYRLTTKYGYEIDFSDKHRFMLANGEWKKGIDLSNNDYLLFDNNYKFPENDIETYQDIKPEDMAYLYGLLISEGTITNKNYICITNTDKQLLEDLKIKFASLNPCIYEYEIKQDKRGWKTKQVYNFKIHNTKFREFLFKQGLTYTTAINKHIPQSILSANKKCVNSFLKGLFIGDGSVFVWKDKTRDKDRLGAAYYTVSKTLIDQLHTLLKAMGYLSFKGSRNSKLSDKPQYFIRLNGDFAIDFAKDIDYPNVATLCKNISRKRPNKGGISKTHNGKYITRYIINNKNVFSKVFNTKEEAQIELDNFISNFKFSVQVKSVVKLDEKDHLYDISLPQTHSYYANGLVNHNTLNRQVFEEVMSGFLSVAASPFEQIKYQAKQNAYKRFNIPIPKSSSEGDFIQNQLILSGTAYYKLNHFYAYASRWKEIISSNGEEKKLRALFENPEDAKDIDPKDYTLIRVPLELTANGYMDMAQIARIKASTTKDVFLREYGACFNDDSEGFYKKSLIDSCTCDENDKEHLFVPQLYGDKNRKYVMGVDPAYEGDNFAIVILEINGRERRIVHCWTTQSSDHKQRLRDGITKENKFFDYCARKIRNLMKHFPCEFIAIDPHGGGKLVVEALMDPTKLEPNEELILEVIDPEEKPKETDLMRGLHIVKIVTPTSEWNSEANYSMKKDMENKMLRFPFSDEISYALAEYYDHDMGDHKSMYDTLDDCIFEIEELKKELTTITVTETGSGREKFGTPENKSQIHKKGRLKKDRFSALLLANWVGRTMIPDIAEYDNPNTYNLSGFITSKNTGRLFTGNSKVVRKLEDLYRNLRK